MIQRSGIEGTPLKTCIKCGRSLPATSSFFYKTKKGLNNKCKKCVIKAKKEWRETNKIVNTYTSFIPESKKCSKCGEVKPASEFYKDDAGKDGLERFCKECAKIKAMFNLYELTKEEYDIMLKIQDNKCPICGVELDSRSKKTAPSVHHDHEIGEVKAILCNNCNLGLGQFGDNVELVQRAANFLKGETP